jgi:signal transduction histidine kinase
MAAGPGGRDGPPWARRPRGPRHASIILAIFIAIVELAGAHVANNHQTALRPLDAGGDILIIVGAAALVVRRTWRIPTYLVSLAATVVYLLAGYPYAPVFFAVLVCIFGAVRTGHRRAVWIATAVGYLVAVLAGRVVSSVGGVPLRAPSVGISIAGAAWTIVALALAEGVRVRTERFAEIARTQAEHARARAEQARRQESDERLRIAQELHDVLGHHLSLINVQAGVGLHLMDEHPGQARAALEAIKEASTAALGEVRSVLGVLRTSDEAAPRAPAPTLANLTTLIDAAETAVVGEPVLLPPEVDRAAFRIIQESLTNVRRHAGDGAHASVVLTYRPEGLVLRVSDDGAGAPGWVGVDSRNDARADARTDARVDRTPGGHARSGESGNGIAGMRARAVALGGTLTAGPGPSGGFVVTATLPIREPS